MTSTKGKTDAPTPLDIARRQAIERAQELAESFPEAATIDYSSDECITQLVIAMYALGLKLGMGVMPDGMAIYIRLSVPRGSVDPRSGMVSFVVHNDPVEVLRKSIQALEASAQSAYWKPDRFADQQKT